jgi:hypothetical protein
MQSISFSLLYKIYMESLSFWFFYMYIKSILKFLTCFSIIKLNWIITYDFNTHTITLHRDYTVLIANWWPFHACLWTQNCGSLTIKITVRNTSCSCLTWYKAFECRLGWTWRLSFLLNIQCTIHCIHWINRYFVVCVYASRVWWLP